MQCLQYCCRYMQAHVFMQCDLCKSAILLPCLGKPTAFFGGLLLPWLLKGRLLHTINDQINESTILYLSGGVSCKLFWCQKQQQHNKKKISPPAKKRIKIITCRRKHAKKKKPIIMLNWNFLPSPLKSGMISLWSPLDYQLPYMSLLKRCRRKDHTGFNHSNAINCNTLQ